MNYPTSHATQTLPEPTRARAAGTFHRATAAGLLACLAACLGGVASARGQYEPNASYYASITTQTGATLKSALASVMAGGHAQTTYATARDFLPFTDANPADRTQMFEFYTRNVIQKPSASHVGFVGLYESREHVWSDSLQGPGDTENSTSGSRGDIHMLKPLSQSVNSTRGNNAFGGATLTGVARNIGGSQWFPGSSDKGDAARIIFYGGTRWGPTLSVVNGNPTTDTQMGDLQAMIRHHYQDVPDLFERRRNDAIARGDDLQTAGDDSPFGGTNNRNAFIDRPEYAWSVFIDQANDARLSVGTPDAAGGSSATVSLGRVLRGAAVPAAASVTLNKAGLDGTYFSVTPGAGATSSLTGRFNAFAMDATGARPINVGLTASTATAGLKSGTVTIDNLDVTTGGGTGAGANDANDVVTVNLSVLDASDASFAAASDVEALTIDFGTVPLGEAAAARSFALYNRASALGSALTARLDLDAVGVTGDGARFATNLSTFAGQQAGFFRGQTVTLDTSTTGRFAAVYTLSFSDENLPGTVSLDTLTLSVTGASARRGDANYDASVDFDDLLALAQNYGLATSATWDQGDFSGEGAVGFDDLLALAQNYGTAAAFGQSLASAGLGGSFAADWALAQSLVPEPATASALVVASFGLRRRRTHRLVGRGTKCYKHVAPAQVR